MDDAVWEPRSPVLDRRPVRPTTLPPSLQGLPPRSVPEVAPTPLQKHYINLSVPVLICGAIAIPARELGARLGDPLVKSCVLIAAPLLVITTADAILRIWRSAWAWMPVDQSKAWFRLAWVAGSTIGLRAVVRAALVAGEGARADGVGGRRHRRALAWRVEPFELGPDGRSTDLESGRG